MFREQARKRLTKKAKKGFRGFPVATVAFYGPDDRRASKLAVGIVLAENEEAVELKRWFAEPGDVREDVRIAEEVLAYRAMCARMSGLPRRSWPTWTGSACARSRWWTGSLAARTRKGSTTTDQPVRCAPSGPGVIAGVGRGSTNDRGQHACVSSRRRGKQATPPEAGACSRCSTQPFSASHAHWPWLSHRARQD